MYQRAIEFVEDTLWPLLSQGAPFAEICERLSACALPDELVALAFRLLGGWVSDGLLLAA